MTTPNMNLDLPVASVTGGPAWADKLNGALSTIDSHTHAPGFGALVPASGLNINADLAFGGNNATALRSARLVSQPGTLTSPQDVGCLYQSGGSLFYNNGSGQAVQITQGATLSATSLGGISGLPSGTASASYASATFAWRSATNVAATMDAGPLIIRDVGASALGITLQSPTGLAGAFSLTLPSALPASSSVLTCSTSAVLSYVAIVGLQV